MRRRIHRLPSHRLRRSLRASVLRRLDSLSASPPSQLFSSLQRSSLLFPTHDLTAVGCHSVTLSLQACGIAQTTPSGLWASKPLPSLPKEKRIVPVLVGLVLHCQWARRPGNLHSRRWHPRIEPWRQRPLAQWSWRGPLLRRLPSPEDGLREQPRRRWVCQSRPPRALLNSVSAFNNSIPTSCPHNHYDGFGPICSASWPGETARSTVECAGVLPSVAIHGPRYCSSVKPLLAQLHRSPWRCLCGVY